MDLLRLYPRKSAAKVTSVNPFNTATEGNRSSDRGNHVVLDWFLPLAHGHVGRHRYTLQYQKIKKKLTRRIRCWRFQQ
jgi:hypothetical protein